MWQDAKQRYDELQSDRKKPLLTMPWRGHQEWEWNPEPSEEEKEREAAPEVGHSD